MVEVDLSEVPVVDNYHQRLYPVRLPADAVPWRRRFTESGDPDMPTRHVASMLFYSRPTQVMAGFLGCAEEEEAAVLAAWISERIGRPVPYSLGYAYLQRLKHSQHLPRPQHVQTDPVAQEAFKKSSGRSSRK